MESYLPGALLELRRPSPSVGRVLPSHVPWRRSLFSPGFSDLDRLDRERTAREKRLNPDRVQTAAVQNGPAHSLARNGRLEMAALDLPQDVHPRWRQFCRREQHTLPQDAKNHPLPTAILR